MSETSKPKTNDKTNKLKASISTSDSTANDTNKLKASTSTSGSTANDTNGLKASTSTSGSKGNNITNEPKTSDNASEPKTNNSTSESKENDANCESDLLPIFCNRIKISVQGYNQNRLIDALIREGIRIYSIHKKSPKLMEIALDTKFKKKAFAQMEKLCYNYSVIGVSGVMPLSKWLIARIGLVVGALVFTVLAAISTTFIWKIDVSGNESVDSLTIVRKLAEVDVSVGKSKSFDAFDVSLAINDIEGIAECTIEVVGTTVKVNVIESKQFIPPDNSSEIGDIVSTYDAEVTKVIVTGGTAKVRIGDRVPKGEVLISREVLDTNNLPVGETRAKGSVYGKVVFSDKTIISTTSEQVVRTGKSVKTSSFSIFGLRIGKKSKAHGYDSYQTVATKSYPFHNTFVPLLLEQTTVYEVKKQLIERPIGELVDEYKKDRLLSLIINAGGSEILTTVTKTEISKGLYSVHLYLEAEMPISQFVPHTAH